MRFYEEGDEKRRNSSRRKYKRKRGDKSVQKMGGFWMTSSPRSTVGMPGRAQEKSLAELRSEARMDGFWITTGRVLDS